MPPRLDRARLADHLVLESVGVRRTVLALRRVILRAAPMAAEAIKFRVLCYYHHDAFFKSIGGNICMIEMRKASTKRGESPAVVLSFIHGASLPDPHHLLRGTAKAKRFLPIPDARFASDPRVAALIRAAAALMAWDE